MARDWARTIARTWFTLLQGGVALSGIGTLIWSVSWYLSDNPLNAIYLLLLSGFFSYWAGDLSKRLDETEDDGGDPTSTPRKAQ